MHSGGSGDPNQYTILALCITIVFFGSNFVPVKGVQIHNYAFFQWVMCNAILLTALPWCLMYQGKVQLHPVAVLGGISWCCGNYLCPLILDRLGLGVGSLLWGTVEMFTAWMSGTFGWLGVEKQSINKPWLNFVGVIVVVAGGFVLSQVTSEEHLPSTITSSSFSSLSSTPLKSNESPDPDHPDDIQSCAQSVERIHVEEEKQFQLPQVTSSPVEIVYYNNPLLQSGAISSLRTKLNPSKGTLNMELPIYTPSSTPTSGSSVMQPGENPTSYGNKDLEVGPIGGASSEIVENPLFLSTNIKNDFSTSNMANSIAVPLSASEQVNVPSVTMNTETVLYLPQSCPSPIMETSAQLSSSFRPIASLSSVRISPSSNARKNTDRNFVSSNESVHSSTICGLGKMTLRPFEEGILLSIVAGLLFGISFNPTQFLVDQSDGRLTAGTLIASHYIGICYTSYVLYVGSILWNTVSHDSRMKNPSFGENLPDSAFASNSNIDVGCIGPAILAGLLWGIGAIAWFVAAETLPISVTFPLISAGPNIVTMCWSLLYFREVQKRKDQFFLSLALILLGLGLFCVWFSNL